MGRFRRIVASGSSPGERESILVPANLPFDEWTEAFGSESPTGALPDRLTHHVRILEMSGEKLQTPAEEASPSHSVFGLNCYTNPRLIRADILEKANEQSMP